MTRSYLADLQQQIEQFVKDNLNPQLPKPGTNLKIINDNCWGNITLYRWEVDILDQPLLQRLRNVLQTGTADLVYPTSDHSRFVHTLGVLGVLSRIIEKISSRRPIHEGAQEVEPLIVLLLRLAALLHDVGHAFLSHVSERVHICTDGLDDFWAKIRRELEHKYRSDIEADLKYHGIKYLTKRVRDELGLRRIDRAGKNKQFYGRRAKIHEIISSMIVQSDAFRSYYKERLFKNYSADFSLDYICKDEDELINTEIAVISKSIIGIPPVIFYENREIVIHSYAAQLINGPFDVDKLDYLSRDNASAGLTIRYDIQRFLNRVLICEYQLGSTKYPSIVIRKLVVDVGASHVIDQIIIGNMMLYFYIYHHQKVLTADSMIIEACRLLTQDAMPIAKYSIIQGPLSIFGIEDADFHHSESKLRSRIAILKEEADHDAALLPKEKRIVVTNLNIADMLIKCISERSLYVRALVAYPRYLGITRYRSVVSTFFKDPDFKQRIAKLILHFLRWFDTDAVRKRAAQLGDKHHGRSCFQIIEDTIALIARTGRIEPLFNIIVPMAPSGNESNEITYLKWPEKKPVPYSFPVEHWIKAYLNNKWACYVVCHRDLRLMVNVFSRYVLYKQKRWVLDPLSTIDAHLNEASVNGLTGYLILLARISKCPLDKRILEKIYY